MQQKIITMTQLALYDKHEGASDQIANDYFRHDYIYRKNLGTRFAVGFGGFIMLLLYWARDIFIGGADVFELDFSTYLTDSIFFMLAILALYSLIGTIQGTREYYLIQKRITRYHALLRQLERIQERADKAAEDRALAIAEATPDPTPPTAEKRPRPPRPPKPDETSETRRVAPLDDLRRTPPAEADLSATLPLVYNQPDTPQRSNDQPNGSDTDNA